MSPYEPLDLAALAELERVFHHLEDELGRWRQRSLKAEAEVQALKTQHGMVPGEELIRNRVELLELERENLELHARIDRAHELVSRLQQKLAFLEREADSGASL